jgi:hypothetical protein
MFTEAAAQDLVGRSVIIVVTRRSRDGRLVRQEQYQARIVRASRIEGVVLCAPSGDELKLPADLRGFYAASPGKYRFRGPGEAVNDPDLTMIWTYRSPTGSQE